MTYRLDIQILRGVAVVLVVLFHLNIPFFSYGFLGVDVFFVISGFLMAILYRSGQVLSFYRRRASRLLPAYFATIVGTLVMSTFVTLPSEHIQTTEQAIFASFFASNIGYWAQNSYFSKAEFNSLLHLWSIGVEIQFYLIMPLLFWLHSRSKVLLVFLALGSMAAAYFLVYISPKTAFFMMPFRIWQFLAGAGVAWYLTVAWAPLLPKPWLGLTSLVLLLGTSILYPVDAQATDAIFGHPGLAASIVTLATVGALTFGLPKILERSVLGIGLSKLGDWSYSIYLAHFPVIVLSLYDPFSGTILTPSSGMQIALIIILTSLFSTILYLIFDKRKKCPGIFQMTGVLIFGVGILAMLSISISRFGYDAGQLNILAAFEDRAEYRCGKIFRIRNPGAHLCELTGLPETAPALALVGNSHADSIKTSFANVAKKNGYRLFFPVSNSPVVDSPDTGQLLAQFRVIGVEGVIVHFSSATALHAYDTGFASGVRAAGIDIVWILDVPTYEFSVPAMIWGTPEVSNPKPINSSENTKLEIQLRRADVQVFDPYQVFCPEDCRLMDDKLQPFYFDEGHLTLTGARELENLMRAAVRLF